MFMKKSKNNSNMTPYIIVVIVTKVINPVKVYLGIRKLVNLNQVEMVLIDKKKLELMENKNREII